MGDVGLEEGWKLGEGEASVEALSLDVIQWRTRTLKRTRQGFVLVGLQ